MKFFTFALLSASLWMFAPTAVDASLLVAKVDVSEQTMRVYENGRQVHTWPVSTAREGKITPRGAWGAKSLSKNHRFGFYDKAPLPHSGLFRGNYAIHGTSQINRLCCPASAGCIRLHSDNAAKLLAMTLQVGFRNMTVADQN